MKRRNFGVLPIYKIHFFPELSSAQEQTLGLQRLMGLLPTVNRDTLFVLLHFLGLVAENAEDRTLADGEYKQHSYPSKFAL